MKMPDTLATVRGFTYFGAMVIFANLLIFITFSSKLKFIKKYFFLIVLALADITAGSAAFTCGLGRTIIYSNDPVPNYTVADCMKTPYVPLIIIGGEWPSIVIFLIGIERLLIVFKPNFYRTKFSKHRIFFIVSSVPLVFLIPASAYGQRLIFGGMEVFIGDPSCVITPTFLPVFDDIHRAIVVVGNFGGFCFTVIALLSAQRQCKLSDERGEEMRSEVKRIRLFIIISCFCVLQASVPQLIFWATVKKLFTFPSNTEYYNAAVYYTGSCVNFFIYLVMKRDFRHRFFYIFFYIFTCGKIMEWVSDQVRIEPVPKNTPNTPV